MELFNNFTLIRQTHQHMWLMFSRMFDNVIHNLIKSESSEQKY